MTAAIRVMPWPDPVLDVLGPRSPQLVRRDVLAADARADGAVAAAPPRRPLRGSTGPALDLPVADTARRARARPPRRPELTARAEPVAAPAVRSRVQRRRRDDRGAHARCRRCTGATSAGSPPRCRPRHADWTAAQTAKPGRPRPPPLPPLRAHAARAGRAARHRRARVASRAASIPRSRTKPCAGRVSKHAALDDETVATGSRPPSVATAPGRGVLAAARAALTPLGSNLAVRLVAAMATADLDTDRAVVARRDATSPVLTGAGHLHRVRASPTSAVRTACGRRTPTPRRPRRCTTTWRDPEIRRRAWQNRRQQRDVERASRTPRTTRSSSSNARTRLHALVTQNVDGLHHAAGQSPDDRRRDPRQRARSEVHVVRLARPDGRDARPRARRRRRSGVHGVRRHPQVGDDQLRREPRARGSRRARSSESARGRRVPRDRHVARACIPPPACPRSRCATAPGS